MVAQQQKRPKINFSDTKVNFIPKGIDAAFPKLTELKIIKCGSKKISHDDLKGFENLRSLDLSYNQLTSLPDDLLSSMTKFEVINFRDNKLEFLSSKLLRPIVENELKLVGFTNNRTIYERYVTAVFFISNLTTMDKCFLPKRNSMEFLMKNLSTINKCKNQNSGKLVDFPTSRSSQTIKNFKSISP
jgi:Leucine rich repeat